MLSINLPRRSQYHEYKARCAELHHKLLQAFPKDVLTKVAKQFGMVDQNGNIAGQKPEYESIVIDYCLYQHNMNGSSFIKNLVTQSKQTWPIEELELLYPMQDSQLGLYFIENIISSSQINLVDVKSGELTTVTDRNLTQLESNNKPLILTRLINIDDFNLCCATTLPLYGQSHLQAERLYPQSFDFAHDILKLLILDQGIDEILKESRSKVVPETV